MMSPEERKALPKKPKKEKKKTDADATPVAELPVPAPEKAEEQSTVQPEQLE